MFLNIEKIMRENIQLTGDKEIIIRNEDLIEGIEEQLSQNDVEHATVKDISITVNTNSSDRYELSISRNDAISDDIVEEPFFFQTLSPYSCAEEEVRAVYRGIVDTGDDLDEDVVSRVAFNLINNFNNTEYYNQIVYLLEAEGVVDKDPSTDSIDVDMTYYNSIASDEAARLTKEFKDRLEDVEDYEDKLN